MNVLSPDLSAHPEFLDAPYRETVLCPGEMLFIPRGHWHFIMALDHQCKCNRHEQDEGPEVTSSCGHSNSNDNNMERVLFSLSVNFWWGPRILLSNDDNDDN